MKWHTILTIAQKDILDAIKNLYILFALLLPIAMSLLFNVAFPDMNEQGTLTIAIFDPDASRLTAALESVPQVELLKASTEQELQEAVNKASGGLSIPAGFDAAVETGQEPELTVYLNRRRGGGEIAAVQQVIQAQVWTLVNPSMPARLEWINLNGPPGMTEGRDLHLDRFLLSMYLVMTLAMTGAFAVPTLLVEEKEKHTLDVLLLSPAGPVEVTLAKALVGLVYSALISGILLVLNHGWEGSWPITLLALFLGAVFIVELGLLMGSLFRNTHQVNTWASIVMMALIIPSWAGAFGPETILSKTMMLIPTYYLSDAIGLALAGEATIQTVWLDLTVLAGAALLVFVAVVWTLKRARQSTYGR